MDQRGHPSYYNIGEEGPDGMVRRSRRQSQEPPYSRPDRPRALPVLPLVGRNVAFSPMSNLSAQGTAGASPVVPQGSVGSASPGVHTPLQPPLATPPGLGGAQPQLDAAAVQAALESHVLVQTVQQQQQHMQQQQQQISQMMSLVETMLSNQGNGGGNTSRERANVSISSLSSSADHAMEVDDGAPIRNPKAESYVPKLPMLDGSRMSKGRRSEIEAWVEYLEVFLPWIALFDDRVPSEVQQCIAKEKQIQNKDLSKGESVRSTRVFLYLRQSFANFPRGLDILKQVEREQLGAPAGYEALRRLIRTCQFAPGLKPPHCEERSSGTNHPKSPKIVLWMPRWSLPSIVAWCRRSLTLRCRKQTRAKFVLKGLDVEVIRYILLHAKIDSMGELERAIKFYDSNVK